MAAKTVEEKIANTNRCNKRGVEPEEHPHVIGRPEVFRDPFHKAAIHQRLVEKMNNVGRKKYPEKDTWG